MVYFEIPKQNEPIHGSKAFWDRSFSWCSTHPIWKSSGIAKVFGIRVEQLRLGSWWLNMNVIEPQRARDMFTHQIIKLITRKEKALAGLLASKKASPMQTGYGGKYVVWTFCTKTQHDYGWFLWKKPPWFSGHDFNKASICHLVNKHGKLETYIPFFNRNI